MNTQRIYGVVSTYFRTKRMQQFWDRYSLDEESRVLDVGGNEFNWLLLGTRPRLTIVNLDLNYGSQPEFIRVLGDGLDLPFKDRAYDVVFSNSVIEHLGTWENQKRFAEQCGRVGARFYVQTPNRRFFLETHQLTPFIHWLPKRLQLPLMRNFTLRGLMERPTREQCQAMLDEIRLLNRKELQQLFPDAEIWSERVLGLTKSLIAARLSPPEPANDPDGQANDAISNPK